MYRCSPHLVSGGGGGASEAAATLGVPKRDPESRGRQYHRLDRHVMQQTATRSTLSTPRRARYFIHVGVNNTISETWQRTQNSSRLSANDKEATLECEPVKGGGGSRCVSRWFPSSNSVAPSLAEHGREAHTLVGMVGHLSLPRSLQVLLLVAGKDLDRHDAFAARFEHLYFTCPNM